MSNLALFCLFAVIVGISGGIGNKLDKKKINRNVIGNTNEVIEKKYRLNGVTGHKKFKDAGNRRTCSAGYKLHTNGVDCVPVCRKGCINGYCYLPNFCRCLDGYAKDLVSSNLCLPLCLDDFSNGHSVARGKCVCLPGYTQSLLTGGCRPMCEERCDNGYCHKPNTCRCNPGYRKLEDTQKCAPICTYMCINGTCTSPDFCTCNPGFKKNLTDPLNRRCLPKCEPACVHGVCVDPGLCHCNEGYVKDTDVIARNVCVHVNLVK